MTTSALSPDHSVCTIGLATPARNPAQRRAVRQLPLLASRVPGVTMNATGFAREDLSMLNGIDELAEALRESREYTLSMYGHLEGDQWQVPLLEIVNPPIWELAHIGHFQEFFCRRWRPDDPAGERTPSRLPGADSLFDSRTVAHDSRWSLAYPPRDQVLRYLEETLAATLEDLASSREDDRHRFRLALFHEDMHGEALLMTLHTLGLPAPRRAHESVGAIVKGEAKGRYLSRRRISPGFAPRRRRARFRQREVGAPRARGIRSRWRRGR